MVFSSLTFIFLFLTIVLLTYFFAHKKVKNIIILISGIIFYAWGEPFYIFVMLISAAIDYFAGRLIHKFDKKQKIRLIFLLVSVIMNISILGIFKYRVFIIDNINAVFGLSLEVSELPPPIGISFYTFQSMSYTIDLYLRKIKVQKNIFNFLSYVTLFPQIVAGPIVRYEDVANEIDDRVVNTTKIAEGIGIFVKGLGKKVLLANNIGTLWYQVSEMNYGEISVLTAWLGILAFTFQLYFDFSGYSDMAVGLGKMLGFDFPQNFNYPYIAKSISEFWRRWHITMGAWFRSYVYIPLGGNRGRLSRTISNLAIVWLLTGIWHGASWNFILWGCYFGFFIIIERLFLGKYLQKIPAFFSTMYTFVLVVIGWVFFQIDGLAPAFDYLKAMFGGNGVLIDATSTYLFSTNIIILVISAILSTEIVKKVHIKLSQKFTAIEYLIPVGQLIVMILSTAYLVNATYNPFLYFRF